LISVIAVLAGVALGLPAVRPALASSAEDVSIDPRLSSFDQRFAGALDWPNRCQPAETKEQADSILIRSPDLCGRAASQQVVSQFARLLPAPPPANVAKKQLRLAEAVDADSISHSDADGHTAIYDIAARTIYLPNGRKLEAHSSQGRYLDDPRYVTEKARGPKPLNLHNLPLREEPVHGVRAIRLIPIGGRNMLGRDGILAHSYMLGSNGQSNGCVSFSDYSAFLNAFLSGDIKRLVVVEHLATAPNAQTAFGWLPETTKPLFGRS
jgi:hypothetical protein